MVEEFGSPASTALGLRPGFTMKVNGMLAKLQLSSDHAEWLEAERSICRETAQVGVVSRMDDMAFDYQKGGQTVFLKVRKETVRDGVKGKSYFIEPAGAKLCLFNGDCLNEPSEAPLVITEGEIDALSFIEAGATRVVSVPNGAAGKPGEGDIDPNQDRQFAYLWEGDKLLPGLQNFKKIILATDNDQPGRILRDELAVRLGRARCWFVKYPEGCKDANDVLVKHGESALQDMIDDATPVVPSRLVPFSAIPSRAARQRYSIGWGPDVDKHIMIVPPELFVVTGTPGAGKSQWTLAMCANLARLHGLKGAILQFEDQPDRNRKDLLAYAGSWKDQEKGGIKEEPEKWVDRMFLTIAPAEDADGDVDFDLDWLRGTIEEAATRHNCKWVLIDPWNEVEHAWKINETETAYTNKALRELKRIARRLHIALIIVTHPSKSGGSHKSVGEMSLYDISGSAAWKNKADHGIIISRETPTSEDTHVKIDKSKNFITMGYPGVVRMRFDARRASFSFVGVGA
jgi:twinkle protein